MEWLDESERNLDSDVEIANEPDKIKTQLTQHKVIKTLLPKTLLPLVKFPILLQRSVGSSDTKTSTCVGTLEALTMKLLLGSLFFFTFHLELCLDLFFSFCLFSFFKKGKFPFLLLICYRDTIQLIIPHKQDDKRSQN